MGLRGPGAKAIKAKLDSADAPQQGPHPWECPGMTRAERVIAFMESLPVTAGKLAGTPWRARPWQKKWLKRVYKTDRKGNRVVRTAIKSVARKNGKTDEAARLALCHLCGPEAEQRGEVYSAANDRLQAGKVFNEAVAIIVRVPWLAERLSIRRHSKEIEDIGPGGTGSTYAALSADVATKHGLSPSFFVYDELGQAPNRHLFDVLDTAMGARAEPLGLVISTQAARDDAPLSELIDYGLRIKRGEIDDPTFDLELFMADPALDPWNPKTWKLANPALNDFRDLADVKRMAAQAERMPSKEASFRNLILNQRVDTTQQLITSAVWNGCNGAVDIERLKGRPCYAALDLGASRDLTCLCLVFTDGDDGKIDVLPFFWLPDDALRESEDRDKAPYSLWRDKGFLLTSPGKTLDPKVVALKIAELHGEYNLRGLAYDRWRIKDLQRELAAIGCTAPLVEFGQGYQSMGPAVIETERLLFECKLNHGGHPLLTWCAANTRAETDASGARKPSKSKSFGRIDGFVAMTMSLAMVTKAPPPKPASVYATRGLLSVRAA